MSVSSQQKSKVSSTVTATNNDAVSTMFKASSTVASVETDSNGCVICEGTVNCPDCADDEYCIMTSLTCNSCPYTYCVPRSNSSINGVLTNSTSGNETTGLGSSGFDKNSKSHYVTIHKIQGAVVGSVIGFVCIMLICWYSFYWRKKKKLAKAREFADKTFNANDVDALELDDIYEDDIYDSDEDMDEFDEDTTNKVIISNNNNNKNNNNNTWNSNKNRNHNDTSMTPSQQLQYINELRSIRQPNIKNVRDNLSMIGDRTSSASTVRTGASNILPIGYIPGVTNTSTMNSGMVKNDNPSKSIHSKRNLSTYNNHLNIIGDIRSHITLGSSILEEVSEDMEDNASTHIKNTHSFLDTSEIIKESTGSSLTTAIKGKPKLVHINESKEMEGYEEAGNISKSIKRRNQNSDHGDNNNITNDRYSMRSDITGTGSYILDFEINPLETRLQPPIPAANQDSITNKLSTINNFKRFSQVSNPPRYDRNSIDDSDSVSVANSDIITIDTKAVESSIEQNFTDQQEQSSNPFGDEHEII